MGQLADRLFLGCTVGLRKRIASSLFYEVVSNIKQ